VIVEVSRRSHLTWTSSRRRCSRESDRFCAISSKRFWTAMRMSRPRRSSRNRESASAELVFLARQKPVPVQALQGFVDLRHVGFEVYGFHTQASRLSFIRQSGSSAFLE